MPKQPHITPAADIPGKLKEAAKRSGKPLEVICARSFLEARSIMPSQDEKREEWKVYLSSYYLDGISEKVRELDVLARRQRYVKLNESVGFNAMLEAFVSCKGFAEDDYPVTFSVRTVVEVEPKDPPILPVDISPGRRSKTGRDAVQALLWFMCGMDGATSSNIPKTVGFDIIKDPREIDKEWQAKGDKVLFEGLDSALRASFYWRARKRSFFHSMQEGLIRVQVPILVFSRPWHDFPIDGGVVGEPIETSLGYVANHYPLDASDEMPVPLFTLLISKERLPDLQKALANLYGKMWDWGAEALRTPS